MLASPKDDPAGYDEASAQIRALFSDEVSDTLRNEIADAYAALGEDVPVAVRSSATAEDLPEASFAGQQDTYLNVCGLEDLLTAVRDCWASLWTARAMAYRARQGIDPAGVSLAVVVQQMVDADSAGVMFTANPSSGRRDETVISASMGARGIGRQRIGQYRQLRGAYAGRHGLSSQTADKAVMTVYAEQHTQGRCQPSSAGAVLSESEAAELAASRSASRNTSAHRRASMPRRGRNGHFFIVQAQPYHRPPEVEAAAADRLERARAPPPPCVRASI